MNGKRLLAILLSLSMMISLISVPSYADDTVTGGLDIEEGIAGESMQDNTESASAFENGSNSYDDFTVDDVEKIDESFLRIFLKKLSLHCRIKK